MVTKRDSICRQIQQMKKIRDKIGANVESYFISYFFSFAVFLEVILGIVACLPARSLAQRQHLKVQIAGPALFCPWNSAMCRGRRVDIGKFSYIFAIGSPR